jgi:hypothetical protein
MLLGTVLRQSSKTEMTGPMSNSAEPYTWVWVDATYLRGLAQRCTQLARDCPHVETSHHLETIGVELMLKAAELDALESTEGEDSLPDTTMPPRTARTK